jgi:class 3 adenylate cyclase
MSEREWASEFQADSELIREVSNAIRSALADLNATVGFCSAACGSDILFAEQMLERHAELHLVLPFAKDDFLSASVDFGLPAMKHWRVRLDALLERAQVHYATKEAYLGDDVLFDFVNSFTQGLAIIRAQQRGVVPQALAVFDPGASKRLGGTAGFLDTWTKGNYPARTIDLRSLRERVLGEGTPLPSVPPEARAVEPNDRMERQVKSMLFADVKDFSKLREADSPRFFLRFLQEVDGVLRSLKNAPTFSNTWGDGLYLVFDQVTDCADAALRLLERAELVGWKDLGFGETTPVRIGIHAGPVFGGVDPIIGKKSYFGSHVTRAARIEPVTIPGCA